MDPLLLRGLDDLKFTEATPIQRMAIPSALEGRDILASAPTGSGKSAAFGLPILQSLIATPGKTRALILAPTRELAQQITDHIMTLGKHTKVRVAPVYGGVAMRAQINAFRRGTEIIVATPGRLIDLMQQKEARLENVDTLVLDEADRMLDMGFMPSVRRIIAALPNRQQTLFFSATIAGAAGALATELLRDPVRVNLAPTATAVDTVTQRVYPVEQHKKTDLLLDLLKDNAIFNAIVFTRTKARAERLAGALVRNDVAAERIHGDRTQAQRRRALDMFRAGKYRVLVATDVAARGIDVADLGHVINFDVPAEAADYVHRIGRTARAQKQGDAITFVCAEEADTFARIERAMGTKVDQEDHALGDVGIGARVKAGPMVTRRTFTRRRRR